MGYKRACRRRASFSSPAIPSPGRAKTRLIPALGPDGAARVHRRLTERSVAAMRASGLPVELRVTGAEPAKRSPPGSAADLAFVPQGDGDLGERLARASADAPVILLGADTPALSAAHLVEAAAALDAQRRGDRPGGGRRLLAARARARHAVPLRRHALEHGRRVRG